MNPGSRIKLNVTVKAGAKQERVESLDPAHLNLKVWVKAPPREGKANDAVLKALAGYLGCPQSRLSLLAGASSRRKVILWETRKE